MTKPDTPGVFADMKSQNRLNIIKQSLFSSAGGMTCADLAVKLKLTQRRTRDYVRHLHEVTREIYIFDWAENKSYRGHKLPIYRLKSFKNESDAKKWWLEGSK